jgi:hypothetical protein
MANVAIDTVNIVGINFAAIYCANVQIVSAKLTSTGLSAGIGGVVTANIYTDRSFSSAGGLSLSTNGITLSSGTVVEPKSSPFQAVVAVFGNAVCLLGESVFIAASGGGFQIGTGSLRQQGTSVPIVRGISGTGTMLLIANSSTHALGGSYDTGELQTIQDIAGVAVVGSIVSNFIVDVKANVGAVNTHITVNPASAITLGGVLNPVAINGLAASADASGTRIVGGLPFPGANGPSIQVVSATAQTWNGVSETVVLDSSAMGGGATFLLPAINTGAGVTDGADIKIVQEDGANSVAITPNGTDKIGEVNAPVATGAARGVFRYTVRASTNNWMAS